MEPFFSARVIDSFLSRTQGELAFYSGQFAEALAADLRTFSAQQAADPTGADALVAAQQADDLFNALRIPVFFGRSPSIQIELWERTLTILRDADESRYEALHKGTPYYFLGVASYMGDDFERALFYMDCAVTQDYRLHAERWHRIPSGRFVRLDDVPEDQFARPLVRLTREHFETWNGRLSDAGAIHLTVESYRTKLVNHAMHEEPALRSAVTAFLSFLLEVRPRQKQLALAPLSAGTAEPFFLHLLKGGLLFETLLKMSAQGKVVCASKPKATLKDLLTNPGIVSALGLTNAPQGLNALTFNDLVAGVRADEMSGSPVEERAVRAGWGVRNATGHNLAWPSRPSTDDYDRLFLLVLGSLALVVERLYKPRLLATGTA